MLREFLLRGGGDGDVAAEHDGARGCGALIDGQNEGHEANSPREVLLGRGNPIGRRRSSWAASPAPRGRVGSYGAQRHVRRGGGTDYPRMTVGGGYTVPPRQQS